MLKESKVKWIIKIAIIVILAIICLAPRCARAEGEPIMFTPDPNASWDDYISANPIPTIQPSPTPEPTEEPTREPWVLGGTIPRQSAYIRAYRLDPEVENGSTVFYYQKLTSPYSLVSSVPSQVAVDRTTNEDWYVYSTSGASGGLPFTLTKTNSMINLVDNYVYLQWEVMFTTANSPTIGYGLDYGVTANFGAAWTISAYRNSDDSYVNNLPVYVTVRTQLDNGLYAETQSYNISTRNLQQRFTFSVDSKFENRKIHAVWVEFYIGMTEEAFSLINANTRANNEVYYLKATGAQTMNVQIDENPAWAIPQEVINQIHGLRIGLLGGIESIFVPTQSQIETWINNHANNNLYNASPANRYWEFYLSLINKFINASYDPDPYITLPSFSFDVDGEKQTIWEQFNWRIRGADVSFSDGTTLFYWTKLVTSIFIVSNLLSSFAYSLFTRIYGIYFSAAASEAEYLSKHNPNGG